MSLALYDRVRETTGVLGTSDAVLLGAVIGYQSFAVVGNTNTCYYTIADSAGNWEVGLGTYSTTGPTLARTTVLSSSNANAKVSFPAGVKDVFLTYPAEKAVELDAASSIATGSMLYGNGTTSYSSLALGTNGYILQSNGTAPTWVAASTIIGGAGGSNTQVQYNNSGALAGSANMTFNGTSLTLANDATIHGLTVGLGGGAVSTNTVLGNGAGASNSTGTRITAVGNQAGSANTQSNCAFFGSYAGYFANGRYNTALGDGAMAGVSGSTTGTYNTAVGFNALTGITTGGNNVAIGPSALNSNTSGANNVAMGLGALQFNSTASANTAVGYQAGFSNTTGALNVFMGYQAGYNSNTANGGNVCVGSLAGYSLTTGIQNTFIGAFKAGSNGSGDVITTGSYNTIIGNFNGNNAGLDIRTASNYIVLSDGAGNPNLIIDNSGNALIGTTAVGGAGGLSIAPNNSSGSAVAVWNRTTTGASSFAGVFRDGGTQVGSISYTNVNATFNTTSDYRLKEDVQPMQDALATVAQLNPVTYKWIKDGSDGQGFIAHELQAIVPDCVTGEKDAVDEEGNPVYQGIDTSFLVATLTKAIQEQQALIESLTTRIAALEAK